MSIMGKMVFQKKIMSKMLMHSSPQPKGKRNTPEGKFNQAISLISSGPQPFLSIPQPNNVTVIYPCRPSSSTQLLFICTAHGCSSAEGLKLNTYLELKIYSNTTIYFSYVICAFRQVILLLKS